MTARDSLNISPSGGSPAVSGGEHSRVVPIGSARAALSEGIRGFAADMRAQGIHVGMGSTPRCVTCGEAWPCSASSPAARRAVDVDALVAAACEVADRLRAWCDEVTRPWGQYDLDDADVEPLRALAQQLDQALR